MDATLERPPTAVDEGQETVEHRGEHDDKAQTKTDVLAGELVDVDSDDKLLGKHPGDKKGGHRRTRSNDNKKDISRPTLSAGPDDDKWSIRRKVWDHMEKYNLANFPRPVHNRIPNFKGSNACGDKVVEMEEFTKAQTVKVNPDKPQEEVRYRALETMKNLLVPTPRLHNGLFNKVTPPPNYDKYMLRRCATSMGTRDFSVPIGLGDKIKVDLVVLGSVAVSSSGLRIGKGEGFADLEYGMMKAMGAITDDVPIVTTVLDDQVFDLPESIFAEHDVPVNFIVTPTRVIECPKRSRPPGIMWSKIDIAKMKQCPILKELRDRQKAEGIDVTLQDGIEPTEEDLKVQEDSRPKQLRRSARRFPRRRSANPQQSDYHYMDYYNSNYSASAWNGRPFRRFYYVRRWNYEPGMDEAVQGRDRPRNRRRPPRRSTNRPKADGQEGDVPTNVQNGPSKREQAPTTDEDSESPHNAKPLSRRRRKRPMARKARENEEHDESGAGGDTQTPSPRRNRRTTEGEDGQRRGKPTRFRRSPGPAVFVGCIPNSIRVSTFKSEVRGKDVHPIRVIWHGVRGYAFLQFEKADEMETALKALEGLKINGRDLKVEKSTSFGANRNRGTVSETETAEAENKNVVTQVSSSDVAIVTVA